MAQSLLPGPEQLPLFSIWMETTKWLLQTTEKFPKHRRFSLTNRMDNLALDILEGITEASYRKDRLALLQGCNLKLTRLRILIRLSHELGHLPHAAYERAAVELNEAGRMIGGWIKQCKKAQ